MIQTLPQGWQRRLEGLARERLERDPSCHDWDHTRRVLLSATMLARQEGADLSIVTAAAILHDIARPEEMASQGREDHAVLGAKMALVLLEREGLGTPEWRERVVRCIRTHRFRNRTGEAPETVEEKVLFDADKLDSLGAIGLARAFHFAGKTGARVHNSAQEALAGHSYGREDSAYREFLVKLQYLPQAMLTPAGTALARERLHFMQEFFQTLQQECFPEPPANGEE
ncbi:MAG: HD domain-containing protein [Oligosphaeraceae bacterium]